MQRHASLSKGSHRLSLVQGAARRGKADDCGPLIAGEPG